MSRTLPPRRNPTSRALLAAACLLPLAVPDGGRAQSREARPEDVGTLDGILDAWYDVVSVPEGTTPDWARDSTLYLPEVRFVLLDHAGESRTTARILDHAAYAREATPALRRGFVEREIHRTTQRFGPMTHVLSTYEYRRSPEGPVLGRGINSIHLFHDGSRWWIVGAMWMDEDETHPIPPEYLPAE